MHGYAAPIFFTLTFQDNLTDLTVSHALFKEAVRKISRRMGKRLQYIVVPEFQKRGAIHYHGLFFNLPFYNMSEWRETFWAHGFVDLQRPKSRIKNISAYIAKYISKENMDSRLFGRKVFFGSRGLFRPLDIFDDNELLRRRNDDILEIVDASTGKHYSFIKYQKKEYAPRSAPRVPVC